MMSEYLDRNEVVKRIKAALRRKTGRTWSVHGGRGTGWGWITVEAPKGRRVSHKANPDCADPFNAPYDERVIEYVREDGRNSYTSLADCIELAEAFGFDKPTHCQGISISPDGWERYAALVEADHSAEPEEEPKPEPVQEYAPIPEADFSNVEAEEVTEDIFINANFAKLNKNCTLAEYHREVDAGKFNVEKCKITHRVRLTAEQWDVFTVTLLDGYSFIAGKGGCSSSAELREVEWFFEYTEEEQEIFRSQSYILAVEVSAEGRETIYVNPEGHEYARYVGLGAEPVNESVTVNMAALLESLQICKLGLDANGARLSLAA